MFVGSINQDVRALLAELAPKWKGRPVYVACSGNFAVERLLSTLGVSDLNSNDYTLYPVVVGAHLSGQDCPVTLNPELRDAYGLEWMTPYMAPGLPLVAHLLLTMEYVKFLGRPEPYHQRMKAAYEKEWAALHLKTLGKITAALADVKVRSFFAGDPVDHLVHAPDDAVAIAFPVEYTGSSKLHDAFDSLFVWNRPEHLALTPPRVATLYDVLSTKGDWIRLSNDEVPELKNQCVGHFQTGAREKPLIAYAGTQMAPRTTTVEQTITNIPMGRLEGEAVGDLRLIRLSGGQLNLLRSEYLGVGIAPSSAQVNVGIVLGDRLVGATGFGLTQHNNWCDAYMMADLAIRPTRYKKLAKLVLAAVLSSEMKAVLEQGFNRRIRSIGTTAFTAKNVSMKYRGIFDIYSRKDGVLNYTAQTGRWSLAEGLAWWKQSHAQTFRHADEVLTVA